LNLSYIHPVYLLQGEFEREDSFIKIINIEPLAGTGHGQYGADIFVEKSNGNETWVAVYEVKRVKGFGGCIGKKGATYAAFFRGDTNVWSISCSRSAANR
jgi:hypothetical protein